MPALSLNRNVQVSLLQFSPTCPSQLKEHVCYQPLLQGLITSSVGSQYGWELFPFQTDTQATHVFWRTAFDLLPCLTAVRSNAVKKQVKAPARINPYTLLQRCAWKAVVLRLSLPVWMKSISALIPLESYI